MALGAGLSDPGRWFAPRLVLRGAISWRAWSPGILGPSQLLNKDLQLVLVLGLETLVSGFVSTESLLLGQGGDRERKAETILK